MDPEELKKYADFMVRYELTYLEVRKGDFRAVLRRKKGSEEVEELPFEIPSGVLSAEEILKEAGEETQAVRNLLYIKSPLVGVFYRAPSPESPAFVEVGSEVKKGATLCIIEAMKVMNEIRAEHEGIVKEILVENGKPVEYGQVLFILQTPLPEDGAPTRE